MIQAFATVSALALPVVGIASLPSTPDLGKAEGQCRAGEKGPAFLVQVHGLKDHTGKLKLEVYPANDKDFLQDDNILVAAGKTFRRVEVPVPSAPVPQLCVRLPAAGIYAVSLLHDRDENRKFNWRIDGIGFSGNPKLGWGKPAVSKVRTPAGAGLTMISIVLNYHHGLGVAPLRSGN